MKLSNRQNISFFNRHDIKYEVHLHVMPMHPSHWFSSTNGYWYHATSVQVWVSSARLSICSSSLLSFRGGIILYIVSFLSFFFFFYFFYFFQIFFLFFFQGFFSLFLPPVKLTLELALRVSQMPNLWFQRLDDSRLPCVQCHCLINAPENKIR